MREKFLATGILMLLIYTLFPNQTMATTKIDTSFGIQGVSLQNFGMGDDEALTLQVQSDKKILAAGYTFNGAVKNLAVSRFLENGKRDITFNANGQYILSLGTGDTIAHSLAIQDDGKILLSGSSVDDLHRLILVRLTNAGYLDRTFGSDGVILFPFAEGEVGSSEVRLSSDNKIIIAATITSKSAKTYAFFTQLDLNGKTDNTFADDGEVSITGDSFDIAVHSIRLQKDGKILAGGSSSKNDTTKARLFRLNADGSLDTTYGSDGEFVLSIDDDQSVIYDLAIGSDGEVTITGAVKKKDGLFKAFIGKVSANGTIVSSFENSGIYTTTYTNENIAYAVSLQNDGTISAAGFVTSPTDKDVFVLNLKRNTSSQVTTVTYIVTDVGKGDDVAYSIATLLDGNILVAGSSANGNDLDIALLRFSRDQPSSAPPATPTPTGITTSGYLITTAPVTEVTRVAAISGGTITNTSPGTCVERCTAQCQSTTTPCYSSCIANCVDGITVKTRGVVYATEPNPTYTTDNNKEDDAKDSTTTPASGSGDSNGSIFPTSDSKGSIFPDSINYYIVRFGQTDDGPNTGNYDSNITNITPGIHYYVRAYAILSTGEILYGNEYTFATDDACFIATAAYGSPLEEHVTLLRQFRDSYLLTNNIGQRFVALYYHFSPSIADTIRDNAILQTVVRLALFPVILLALFLIKTTLITQLFCLSAGCTCILLLAIKYVTSQQGTAT